MLGLGKKIALIVGTTMIPTLRGGSLARGGRGSNPCWRHANKTKPPPKRKGCFLNHRISQFVQL